MCFLFEKQYFVSMLRHKMTIYDEAVTLLNRG